MKLARRAYIRNFYVDVAEGLRLINPAQRGTVMTETCVLFIGKEFHRRNIERGFWNDLETGADLRESMSRGQLAALLHSELSEALEGIRKDLMDDKLPNRKMVEVELADAVIRAFDTTEVERLFIGDVAMSSSMRLCFDGVDSVIDSFGPGQNFPEILSLIHTYISQATLNFMEGDRQGYVCSLATAMRAILAAGWAFDLDISGAVIEKTAYNLRRSDHNPAERMKVGGKAF